MKTLIIFFVFSISFSFSLWAQSNHQAQQFEALSGIKLENKEASKWDFKYSKKSYVFGKAPEKFLAKNYHYLKSKAKVLDVGMGEGRHAVFLAVKGHEVTGIDISKVAVRKAHKLAKEAGVKIKTITASLNEYNFEKNSFDAIICFYYLDRKLNERMMSWLKPGGVLVYESYTDKQRRVKGFENFNKNYLLREGELLEMFRGNKVLKYEEPQHRDNYIASIIVEKPTK